MTSTPPVGTAAPGGAEVLGAAGLRAGYGSVAVVTGLDLSVRSGEVVAVLGPNGAGKSTTLLTMAGAIPALGGELRLHGRVDRRPLHRKARDGLGLVTEERSVFRDLSCRDNLLLGRGSLDDSLDLVPELRPLLDRRAGLLSGGEQQMLTVARALAGRPQVLLVDEVSLGLAPRIVDRLLAVIRSAATERGVGVLLVEQSVTKTLAVADRAVVLHRGRVVLEGPSDVLRSDPTAIERAYLDR